MATATESAQAAAGGGQFAADLAAGVALISETQTITFTTYVKQVLPLDGFVFWIRADLTTVPVPLYTATVQGSLHYATTFGQDQTQSIDVNRVIFTSTADVDIFNTVNPQTLLVGDIDGLRFSFSSRGSFYRQSGLYHYQGDALYPEMATQLIDDLADLPDQLAVVSNSLPLWLSLDAYCPMYPSYLVPPNITPPWCSVHIEPSDTRALQPVPYISANRSHYQLASDRVYLTFYGLKNNAALDFQDYINTYSLNTDNFGLMNEPIMRDEKKLQAELGTISQKKTIEYEICYYQTRIQSLALQLITSASINVYVEEYSSSGLAYLVTGTGSQIISGGGYTFVLNPVTTPVETIDAEDGLGLTTEGGSNIGYNPIT